jgi:hypothetical protein
LFLSGCSLSIPSVPWVETSFEISPSTRTDYDSSIDAQLATLTRQLEKQLSGLASKDIGILQIVDLNGEEGNFEKYIKDELVNRLSRTSLFRVFPIDELAEDSIGSDESLIEKFMHVFKREPVYLTGTTVNLPNGIKLGIQIVSIESGQILSTASMTFRKDETLLALMEQGKGALLSVGVNNYSDRSSDSRDHYTGKVIKTTDNDYIELIKGVYTLYIKSINFEYGLYTDEDSTVEIFLNDDYRVMSSGDMINFSYGSHQFVLALHRVSGHKALFTFAQLSGDSSNVAPEKMPDDFSFINIDSAKHSDVLLSGLVPRQSEQKNNLSDESMKHCFLLVAWMATPTFRRKFLS